MSCCSVHLDRWTRRCGNVLGAAFTNRATVYTRAVVGDLSRFLRLLKYGSLPWPVGGHPWKSPVENFIGPKVRRSPAAKIDENANSETRRIARRSRSAYRTTISQSSQKNRKKMFCVEDLQIPCGEPYGIFRIYKPIAICQESQRQSSFLKNSRRPSVYEQKSISVKS